MANNMKRVQRRSPLGKLALVALGGTIAIAACDLDVTDPDVARGDDLTGPENLTTLFAGALSDFALGFSGGGGNNDELVTAVGLITDEMYHSGTFSTRREVTRRSITPENSGMVTVFRNLHRGRAAVEEAMRAFEVNDATDTGRYGELAGLAGYSYLQLAENYCSGVPVSRLLPDDSFELGDPLTTEELLNLALQRFETGQEAAAVSDSDRAMHLGAVGRARALLNLGRFDDAAAAVAGVPTDFAFVIEHSANSSRQVNGIWAVSFGTRRFGVAHGEGGTGLPFRAGSADGTGQDPRVPWGGPLQGIDAPYAHFLQEKYADQGSPVTLASGIEARLIEAEAALRPEGAGVTEFVAIHNTLRARVGLDALDPVEVAAMEQRDRVDLHFEERAFWLYLTATRLGDMRRLVRQYERDSEEVFPTGAFMRLSWPDLEPVTDGSYGSDVNFPVPFDERNNPNFQECISRDA